MAGRRARALIRLGLKYAIPAMLANGGGAAVNLSSAMGERAAAGGPSYPTSKHAVRGLTQSAALAYGTEGVRVNSVGPGVIKTGRSSRAGGFVPRQRTSSASSKPPSTWSTVSNGPATAETSRRRVSVAGTVNVRVSLRAYAVVSAWPISGPRRPPVASR